MSRITDMATADRITIYDGRMFYPGDEIPDLGSLVCVSDQNGKRSYEGLLSDFLKLPKKSPLEIRLDSIDQRLAALDKKLNKPRKFQKRNNPHPKKEGTENE